ncbi:hypothetical protein PVAND_017159 [Polypedilum vanderplanki]|uniref:MD-2-related lipid-recognition domain-containing protein n=1 Tax=Polypedilum vanderplanki TaxID=319348 RepID=A0A9J6BHF7_POLVA|nr:hypothetical protein PVAND_017159 [Polypedilum vanderplanki]
MKFLKIILFFYFTISSFTFGDVNFKTITCKSDNVWSSIQVCSISSTGLLNIAGKFLKTLEKPYDVQIIISKSLLSNYFQVINNRFEWCSFMSGTGNYKIISPVTSILKSSMPTIFHNCPYSGKYEVKDFKMNQKMNVAASTLLPFGNYKLEIYVYKKNSTIFNLVMTFEVTTILSTIVGK